MIEYKKPSLSLSELYDMKKKKEVNRTKSFDYIIELCHRRIRNIASYGGMNCFYEIPGLLIGYPLYRLDECTSYVIEKLRSSGLLVQLLPPPHVSVIYVSWDPQEIKPRRPALMGRGQGKETTIKTSRSSIPLIDVDNGNHRIRNDIREVKMIESDMKLKITNPLKDRFRIF